MMAGDSFAKDIWAHGRRLRCPFWPFSAQSSWSSYPRWTLSDSKIAKKDVRLTAMEFLSGFRSNCSFYYLDRGLYFSVLPRRRCQEFTYSELVSVLSYSFLSSPSGSFTELEFLMSKGGELNTKILFHMPTAWWTLCYSFTTSL